MNSILSGKQKVFLESMPEIILSNFYLTGGTALSAFYLKHRISIDLDFFTEFESGMPPLESLAAILDSMPLKKEIHYQRLFDRRIFELIFEDGETLKVEFTVYPFASIQDRKQIGNLKIDSLLNIVTGKLFAMADRYDPKDFVDLYFVLMEKELKLRDLISRTENRFQIKGLRFIIPERLLMVKKIQTTDLPLMVKDINVEQMKRYFLDEARIISKS